MEISGKSALDVRELVLVDAHLGSLVLNFNQVDSAKYRMVYDNVNDYTKGLPGAGPVRVEGSAATGINDVDRAYDYAGWTYDFYNAYHGRDSIDNKGMKLVSTVRYCPSLASCPYANAFWNSSQMVYGSGYAGADDVVAHELTHGVTEHESNLFYYMQSGAINESLSDIWGELIDLSYDDGYTNDDPGVRWLLGENVPGGAIRSMSNPPAYGDPDKISSTLYYCSDLDNGGVHINSGVANKAAYLMVDGGSFNGYTVAALGITKTIKIWYETQIHLLTSASDFQDLDSALLQACKNLSGTFGITNADCNEVSKATAAVEMNRQPTLCAATDTMQCTNYNFGNTFDSEFAGWTPQAGLWTNDATTYYTYNVPDTSFSSTARTSSKYANFDIQVYMRRLGDEDSPNGVMIRGTPTPLGANNRWHSGYGFFFKRNGSFGVFRYDNGVSVTLSDYYVHPAVYTGDSYNLLRVVAQDSLFKFYINNILVWSGSDSTYTNGYIGLIMYNATLTGDFLQADSAILNGGTAISLLKDDFENPVRSLWTSAVTTGVNTWHYPQSDNPYDFDANYPSSGFYSLWGDNIDVTSDSYTQMNQGVALPAGNSYMTFKHAYSFEADSTASYDGGLLEYSANGGAWTNATGLFINNGYNGTIVSGYGNPLGGNYAFVNRSNGLITSRLALNTLAGQNVRFRYRIGTDSIIGDWGWFIDDVDIYVCANPGGKTYLPHIETINAAAPSLNFHSGFNGSSAPWAPISGNWTTSDIHFRAENPTINSFASASYGSTSYNNFVYTARIKRSGCTTCSSRLFVRGTPYTLMANKNWRNAYSFNIASNGQFSIWETVNGVENPTPLAPWTVHSAINTGESWNVFKVIANGSSLYFYINGVLVWSVADTSLSSGNVGVGMYRASDAWDVLAVDWAQLSTISATSAPEALGEVVPGIPNPGGSSEMASPLP